MFLADNCCSPWIDGCIYISACNDFVLYSLRKHFLCFSESSTLKAPTWFFCPIGKKSITVSLISQLFLPDHNETIWKAKTTSHMVQERSQQCLSFAKIKCIKCQKSQYEFKYFSSNFSMTKYFKLLFTFIYRLYWLIFYIFLRNFRRNIWDKVNTHKTIEKLTSEKFLWHFYSQKRLVDWIEWLILILSSFNNHFHSQQQKNALTVQISKNS